MFDLMTVLITMIAPLLAKTWASKGLAHHDIGMYVCARMVLGPFGLAFVLNNLTAIHGRGLHTSGTWRVS